MMDLRSKYDNLLGIMREEYKNDDGTELTFYSDNFAGRMTGLMCLFTQYGVTSHLVFGEILGEDWEWEHYCKVVKELMEIGAVDEHYMSIANECARVISELKAIAEDNFYA